MNTNNLKKYAPQARRDFMAAVGQRLNQFGIHADSKGKLTVSTPVVSGSVMQIEGLSFDAGLARAHEKLVQRAEQMGFEALVEQMAYTWFNRLSAIRFMELHGYLDHNLRVLSPSPSINPSSRQGLPGSSPQGSESPTPSLASGFRHSLPERRTDNTLPEILAHAQDVATDLGLDRNRIVELKLAGNKDEELYRTLLLGQCHQLHQAMPFLFEALDDETELLLPDNLTRTDSILRGLVDSIPEDDWQQVEIIGWLYQFYISEKKDQVIGSVVKSEDIPAATQLFTPNWIVKYLVQNSVGRQWLMTYPDSGLKAQMEYYIEPAEQEPSVVEALAAITPTSIDPETLKVLDPACGSGHILVEAYDILKAIYEERGYRVRDIPKLILEKNLYGLDIDDRAAQLAGFALMMKAREDDRRIFTRDIKLNVLAIQSSQHLFAASQARHSGTDCRNPDCMDSSELAIPGTGYPLPSGYDGLADLWRRLDLHNKIPRGSMDSIFDEPQPVDMTNVRHSGMDCRNPDCMDSSELAIPGTGYPHPGGYDGPTNTVDDIEFKQLRSILALFEQAKTLGSLIQVPQEQAEFLRSLTSRLQELTEQGDSMQKPAANLLLPYVHQAWLLAEKYDAVVANPPYMGGKGINAVLKDYAKRTFVDSKSDLFAMFIERGFEWCKPMGLNSMVTMQSWMFLSSYQGLREKLLTYRTVSTFIQIGYNSFPELNSKIAQACAFSVIATHIDRLKGRYINLNSAPQSADKNQVFLNRTREIIHDVLQVDFKKIPGSPIIPSTSDKIRHLFSENKSINEVISLREGIHTADNDRFLRFWFEVSSWKLKLDAKSENDIDIDKKCWIPYNKGGAFRKWYGNNDLVIAFDSESRNAMAELKGHVRPSQSLYFKPGGTWSALTSGNFGLRYYPSGFLFDSKGQVAVGDNYKYIVALMNTNVIMTLAKLIMPTLDYKCGDVKKLPYLSVDCRKVEENGMAMMNLSKDDWDSYETSWEFTKNPLISHYQQTLELSYSIVPTLQRGNAVSDAPASRNAGALPDAIPRRSVGSIKAAFEHWQTQSQAAIAEMQRLEEENNRLFIEAYSLQDELTPEVPKDQITLTRADQEKDIQRLISYAIGCMMGRYRLDRPGLIYAHAGNVDFEAIYNAVGANSFAQSFDDAVPGRINSPLQNPFPADEDGILPLTDQEWFKDDATNRYREFLVAVWGEDSLQQNLEFVAESLTLSSFKPKKGETSLDTVRRYLSNQFYKDHLQTYKKRPIYWLFSSGKQKAFECLVYLHRYNDSTLARMRTEYVTPLLGKYSAYADQLNQQLQDASSSEATRIKKDIQALEKKQTELRQFDDKLKHYADMRIKIDLDDGVKVNYGKFGDLLAEVKAVTGGSE